MKKIVINFGAVLVALIIGITINIACAEKIDKPQKEEGGAGASMTAGLFRVIDGLLIGPDGKVYNKLASSQGQISKESSILTHESIPRKVSYDDQGRISSILYDMDYPGEYGDRVSEIYSYNGLTVTIEWIHNMNDHYNGFYDSQNGTCILTYLPLKDE